jgi:hypothetical protein
VHELPAEPVRDAADRDDRLAHAVASPCVIASS